MAATLCMASPNDCEGACSMGKKVVTTSGPAEDAYEPRREAVDGRPQHHGYHHAGYAPAVEVACALAHWQQQQARHHGEERYARTHEGACDRAPAAVGGGDVGRDVVICRRSAPL